MRAARGGNYSLRHSDIPRIDFLGCGWRRRLLYGVDWIPVTLPVEWSPWQVREMKGAGLANDHGWTLCFGMEPDMWKLGEGAASCVGRLM